MLRNCRTGLFIVASVVLVFASQARAEMLGGPRLGFQKSSAAVHLVQLAGNTDKEKKAQTCERLKDKKKAQRCKQQEQKKRAQQRKQLEQKKRVQQRKQQEQKKRAQQRKQQEQKKRVQQRKQQEPKKTAQPRKQQEPMRTVQPRKQEEQKKAVQSREQRGRDRVRESRRQDHQRVRNDGKPSRRRLDALRERRSKERYAKRAQEDNIRRPQVRRHDREFRRLQRRRRELGNQIAPERKQRLQLQNRRLERQRNWLRAQRSRDSRGVRRDFRFHQHVRVVERRDNRTVYTALAGALVGVAVGSYFIHFNDDSRLKWRTEEVYTEHLGGGWTKTVVVRLNGVRIITVRDSQGFIVRRYLVRPGNHVTVLFDNQPTWWDDGDLYVRVDRVRYTGPPNRYIVEPSSVPVQTIYETITADPIAPVNRTYTLNQILVNRNLRGYMPRIDVDTITFDTGSAQVPSYQISRLEKIGVAIEQAIKDYPGEVYLIEGHTDAQGSAISNLDLSDRRAVAVSDILTEYFEIPPENLVTQGYGEDFLKIQRRGPEVRNRRVAIRRITPLLGTGRVELAWDHHP